MSDLIKEAREKRDAAYDAAARAAEISDAALAKAVEANELAGNARNDAADAFHEARYWADRYEVLKSS